MSKFQKMKDSLADAALNEILARGAPILGNYQSRLDLFLNLSGAILLVILTKSFQALWTTA